MGVGPQEYTDGPFLLESHWRETWRSVWGPSDLDDPETGVEFLIPVAKYCWESHMDKALPEGHTSYLPEKWFSVGAGLRPCSAGSRDLWESDSGEVCWINIDDENGQFSTVVRESFFTEYCKVAGYQPVWFFLAERSAWEYGNNRGKRRRAEGVGYFKGGKFETDSWSDDS